MRLDGGIHRVKANYRAVRISAVAPHKGRQFRRTHGCRTSVDRRPVSTKTMGVLSVIAGGRGRCNTKSTAAGAIFDGGWATGKRKQKIIGADNCLNKTFSDQWSGLLRSDRPPRALHTYGML